MNNEELEKKILENPGEFTGSENEFLKDLDLLMTESQEFEPSFDLDQKILNFAKQHKEPKPFNVAWLLSGLVAAACLFFGFMFFYEPIKLKSGQTVVVPVHQQHIIDKPISDEDFIAEVSKDSSIWEEDLDETLEGLESDLLELETELDLGLEL